MGLISAAGRFLTNAFYGGGANIQSKSGEAAPYFWRFRVTDTGSRTQITDGKTVTFTSAGGINLSKPTTYKMLMDGTGILTSWLDSDLVTGSTSGSLMVSTGTVGGGSDTFTGIGELPQGTDDYYLRAKHEAAAGMAWEAISHPSSPNYYASSVDYVPTGPGAGVLSIIMAGGATTPLTTDIPTQEGATNYVSYFSDPLNITGTTGLQYDGSDLTIEGSLSSSGSIVSKVHEPPADADYSFSATDYHVHMVNERSVGAGITITGTLPPAAEGKELLVSTYVVTNAVSSNLIVIVPTAGDNINTGVSTFIINDNGDKNYWITMFRALDNTKWVAAQMEGVV